MTSCSPRHFARDIPNPVILSLTVTRPYRVTRQLSTRVHNRGYAYHCRQLARCQSVDRTLPIPPPQTKIWRHWSLLSRSNRAPLVYMDSMNLNLLGTWSDPIYLDTRSTDCLAKTALGHPAATSSTTSASSCQSCHCCSSTKSTTSRQSLAQ